MTVKTLADTLNAAVYALPSPDREVKGAYIGDLLSWVMGRACADSVWITIMSNINCIAVATLSDVSCILLAEGVTPDDELVRVANERGVNLLGCAEPAYEAACRLSALAI